MSILDQIDKTLAESGFKSKSESENFELQNFERAKSKKIDPQKIRSVSDAERSPNDRAPPEQPENKSSLTSEPMFTCPKCGSCDAWELLTPGCSSSTAPAPTPWRCLHCDPPAARWMIKRVVRRAEVDSTNAQTLEASRIHPIDRYVSEGVWPQSRVTLACGRPACGRCSSALVIEFSGRDGDVFYKCWTCRNDIDARVIRSIPTMLELTGPFSR